MRALCPATLLLALLATGCASREASYACGPVGSYLFCALDEACVGHASVTGATRAIWACAPERGCETPAEDYCGPDALSAECSSERARATDGSRPLVSVVQCSQP
jgi:hypothetical protein